MGEEERGRRSTGMKREEVWRRGIDRYLTETARTSEGRGNRNVSVILDTMRAANLPDTSHTGADGMTDAGGEDEHLRREKTDNNTGQRRGEQQ